MGREAFTAALCWFAIGGALAVNSLRDGESASQLYRNMPSGVYASGAPYGAYSFQVPLIAAPKPTASRVIPVTENYSFQNMNSYLKDSYGNRFLESKHSPQSVPFKPFPQQFIKLQELPAHFAQPIPAPSFTGFKQATPQIIVGSHYRLPLQPLQTASPIKQQFGFPHGDYAGNIKSLAPQSLTSSQFHGPVIQLPVPGQSYNFPGQSFHYGTKVTHNQPRLVTPISTAQQQLSNKEAIQSFYYGTKVTHNKPQLVTPIPTAQLQSSNNEAIQSFHYGTKLTHNQPRLVTPIPTAQQQSSSNEAIYANAQSEEQYHNDEPKFQQLQGTTREESSEEDLLEPIQQTVHHSDKVEKKVPVRETTITSFMNGRKTRVNLKTKPPVPFLDISLLEPLTFDNPLVPQVQHFLPKISEATYHKLPEYTQSVAKKHQKPQKIKSYDSGTDNVKPKKFVPKKKQRYPLVEVQNSYYDEIPSASTVRPVITVKGTPNESPEFSYEINSPNYKESYKEQSINYKKETQSEPMNFTYGTQKHEEPVHFTYVHSSKEPVHIKEVHYESKGETPKHFVHKFKSDEQKDEKQHDTESSSESSEEDSPRHSHNEHRDYNEYENHNKHYVNQNKHENSNKNRESLKPSSHLKPEHREQDSHHKPISGSHQHDNHNSFKPIQYYTKTSSGSFQPVSEYDEEIQVAAAIKVNPSQHVQPQSQSRPQKSSSEPQQHSHPSAPHHNPAPPNYAPASNQKHHAPTTHVHEKIKSIIIEEETPEHSDDEHLKGMFGREEDKEKDFEKAYKNAAFGFPAYGKSVDAEKDVYNPSNYGVPRDHSDYDFKHSPFQQYHDQSDKFPKSARLSYKDDKDKTKEDYFLDYSISKPESLTDHYKNKVDYYKLYKQQKPEKYIAHDEEKKQKLSEKYTAIPYNFYPTQDFNMKQFFAQYKATPFVREFDYSKGMPRDNSAHSSQPNHRYKSNTFFVEPQFQYGFEPVSIPRLLDSELATMASNDSPESEKPGITKKIYKENFYIKKTSTSDPGHSS